ncbi:MAG: 3-deoxy-manno-octulosonate cytidylyltransferase [Gammaproteobacteria bacterium]
MKIVAVIPARMGSSRFPGKPLAPILGKPMIEHVYRRVALCEQLDTTVIATCDEEIRQAAEGFGAPVVMTSAAHERASDRVAEAVGDLDADIIVMVQGDEPMIYPDMIDAAITPFRDDSDIGCVNLSRAVDSREEYENPNTIKVVTDLDNRAMYMSRAPIPTPAAAGLAATTVLKQVCVIVFTRSELDLYTRLAPTPLEQYESVDMLRLMEHGRAVHMVPTDRDTAAVDCPEDVIRVEALLRNDALVAGYS